jgi:hypothetical protein
MGGFTENVLNRFVMGFGAVAVPEGCQVKEVQEVLLAADYYQVRGQASRGEETRAECAPHIH